jgi:pimeloyl-ACP methyl ester carboxylesterase
MTDLSSAKAVIRLLDYRSMRGDGNARSILTDARKGDLESALGKGSRQSFDIQTWEAARRVVGNLGNAEREYVSLWADLRLQLFEALRDNVRLEREITRHVDWLKVRETASESPDYDKIDDPASPTPSEISAALRRREVPVSLLQQFIRASAIDWTSNNRSDHKAYVMACWSELAYLQLAEHEMATLDRYKVFEPSLVRRALAERKFLIDLEALVPQVAEFRVQVLVRKRYLYVVADMWGAVVVAVRGTRAKSVEDWIINFTATKVRDGAGFEHMGFANEARFAQADLLPLIRDRSPVYFTGHSMGGAVAALLAKKWEGENDCKTPYIFASPRFEGGKRLEPTRAYAYVRPFDIVPHVPSKLLRFSDPANQNVLPEGERQRGIAASLLHWVRFRSADQHSMETHRRLMGLRVNCHHADTAYVDAIMDVLKSRHS